MAGAAASGGTKRRGKRRRGGKKAANRSAAAVELGLARDVGVPGMRVVLLDDAVAAASAEPLHAFAVRARVSAVPRDANAALVPAHRRRR